MPGIEVTPIHLNDEDVALIADITNRFPEALILGCESETVGWVEQQMADVRSGLTDGLTELDHAFTDKRPVIHVSCVLNDELPPTPTTYQTPEKAEVYSFDIAQLALTSLSGMVYGNRHVRNGRILADIFPKTAYAQKADTAFGSGETFDFHADGAVHRDTTPNLFSLHCIRNSEQAPTFFSSVSEQDFDAEIFAALQEPVYTIYYEPTRSGAFLSDTPIVQPQVSGKYRLNYYGKDKASGPHEKIYRQALNNFDQVLHDNVQEVTLQPGDIIFVDNRHIQHGRRAFQAAVFPDDRRWLRRVFVGQDTDLVFRIVDSEDRILDSNYAT